MVRQGFSLSDLRNLFMDRFIGYYQELIYLMEQSKELKEGTYQNIRLSYNDTSLDNAFDIFLTKPK